MADEQTLLNAQVSAARQRSFKIEAERWPAVTLSLTVILAVFGFALIFQSSRWSKTPAYANLLDVFSAQTWGLIYLGATLCMVVGLVLRHTRWVGLAAHALTFMLLFGWELGFLIRYFTDSATTIVNVISWSTYVGLVMWSTRRLDDHTARG
jgi:hypothetical protein